MPQVLAEQRTEAWFAARKGIVTASLGGAILGCDPHKGPLAAFNEITGTAKGNGNRHTRWGIEHEAHARDEYEIVSGNLVMPAGFWVHPCYSWLGASPDGLIGAHGLVEIKCLGKLPEDIPPQYLVQMLIQLACTGRDWCDFYVWIGNEHTFLRRVLYECKVINQIVADLEDWYKRHILTNTPPSRRRTG